MVIKRIGPLSCAKIVGTLYVFVGLIVGALFSLAAMFGVFASDRSEAPLFFGAFLSVGAIIFFPVMYGCVGFVSSLVGAWLYNLLAGFVGGIEMEVQ